MNIQDQILALLHGDLVESQALNQLMHSLADSRENQQLLLNHIAMSNRFREFSGMITTSVAADSAILEKVSALQGAKDKGASMVVAPGQSSLLKKQVPAWLVVIILLFSLAIGSGISFLLTPEQTEVRDDKAHALPVAPREKNDQMKSVVVEKLQDSVEVGQEERFGARPRNDIQQAVSRNQGTDVQVERHMTETLSAEPVRFLAPQNRALLKAGSVVSLQWNDLPDTTGVVAMYSLDSGSTWEPIARDIVGTSIKWKVPDMGADKSGLIRIAENNSQGVVPSGFHEAIIDTTLNLPTFSPDGQHVLTTDYSGKMQLFNIRDWQVEQVYIGHENSVIQACFNADGSRLASVSLDGTGRVWDVVTGKELVRLDAKGRVVQIAWSVAYNPNGDTLALGNDDGSISIFDVASGEELYTFQAHQKAIRNMSYNADGTKLIAASTDGTASIHDAGTSERLREFSGHGALVNAVRMTSKGDLVVTAGFDGLVKFWNAATGDLIRSVNYFDGEKISMIEMSPDGKLLAVGAFGKNILLVDVGTGEVLESLPIPVNNPRIGAYPTFSPDSRSIVVCHENSVLFWRLNMKNDTLNVRFERS